jgi:membrane protease YdiL (CAAX protease family)
LTSNTYLSTPSSIVIEFFALIGLPLYLFWIFPSLFQFRSLLMFLGLFYVVLIQRQVRFSPSQLGLKPLVSLSSFLSILPFTFFSLILLLFINRYYPQLVHIPLIRHEAAKFPLILPIFVYAVISVPLQEFLFRGFYLSRLQLSTSNPYFLCFFSAFVFMLLHTPFGLNFFTFSTFIFGLYYAFHFLRFRHLFPLMFSHFLIGALAVYLTLS